MCAAVKIFRFSRRALRKYPQSKPRSPAGAIRSLPTINRRPLKPTDSNASALISTASLPVGIYARVSTSNQVGGRFDSCKSQAAYCRDFLNKHAAAECWHEAGNFVDAAYSGANMNRPGMQALMRQIEHGAIKIVLIFKLERRHQLRRGMPLHQQPRRHTRAKTDNPIVRKRPAV